MVIVVYLVMLLCIITVNILPYLLLYCYKYTVNHKKYGSTFVIITLENLDRFL